MATPVIAGWEHDESRRAFRRRMGDLVLLVHQPDGWNWGYSLWRDRAGLGGEVRAAWNVFEAAQAAEAAAPGYF